MSTTKSTTSKTAATKTAAPAKKAPAKAAATKKAAAPKIDAKTFIVKRGHLTEAVDIAGQAVASGGSTQAFSLFRLAVSNSRLVISGTNGEVAIAAKVKVDNKASAQAFIPARVFTQVVKACDAETIALTFTTTGTDLVGDVVEVHVKSGAFEVVLVGGNGDQFRFLEMPKGKAVDIDAEQLVQAITSVAYAASDDEAKPVLMGVRVSSAAGKLTLAGTDSYRLAHAKAPGIAALSSSPLIVRADALRQVVTLIGKIDNTDEDGAELVKDDRATVKVTMDDRNIGFESEMGDTLVIRLVEGKFPAVDALVPDGKSIKTRATVNREALIAAVQKVKMLVAKDSSMTVDISRGKMVISAAQTAVGKATTELDCALTGSGLSANYNPGFLLDAIRAFDGDDEVTFALVDATKPLLLGGADTGRRFALIMPVKRDANAAS